MSSPLRDEARLSTILKFVQVWANPFVRDIRFGQFLTLISRYLQDREGIPDMWNVRDEDWPDILERLGVHYVQSNTNNTE